jgi:hypothetical protein
MTICGQDEIEGKISLGSRQCPGATSVCTNRVGTCTDGDGREEAPDIWVIYIDRPSRDFAVSIGGYSPHDSEE